jgi:hypothetical protein
MANGISKRFKINYDFTKDGVTKPMTDTICADTAEQARVKFDADTVERSKYRSGTRQVTSVKYFMDNPTYSAAEDFANRYGVDPVQYEEE